MVRVPSTKASGEVEARPDDQLAVQRRVVEPDRGARPRRSGEIMEGAGGVDEA